ncbi:hypothetical protein COF68_06200 [Bacillus toyonensis]|uniref:hypothetical protein n=1 Tax=Bacillus toyonensis TaxID=155322 RepID=UPI000BFCB89C|nr:hypothetical protein [Bacillus toyonensis]PHE64425.1 hypothetical protein COF68_06200 [Bacillus toyonensis]
MDYESLNIILRVLVFTLQVALIGRLIRRIRKDNLIGSKSYWYSFITITLVYVLIYVSSLSLPIDRVTLESITLALFVCVTISIYGFACKFVARGIPSFTTRYMKPITLFLVGFSVLCFFLYFGLSVFHLEYLIVEW